MHIILTSSIIIAMITTVKTEAALIDILAAMAPDSSKTTLRSWIKEKRVLVDGVIAKRADATIFPGQTVKVGAKVQLIGNQLPIIYEDAHLIAIDKPAGLLSVATAFEKGETAHAILKKHFHPRKVMVVHRLDQDTSGVMLFALSDEGYHGLKALFSKHEIERSYCAIVEGLLPNTSGTWESYLYEDSKYHVHSTTNPADGELAITHYLIEKASPKYSRLKVTLDTGKKNQIRVHCQDHGIPVVGDKKYGAATDPLKRLCLHAELLAFVHPVTGKNMKFTSPPPGAFDRLAAKKR